MDYQLLTIIVLMFIAIVGWELLIYYRSRSYKMGRPCLYPTLKNLSIRVYDENGQALTSIKGYKTDNSGEEHKIQIVFYVGFDNMGELNAKPIDVTLQWKDNHGNLLPKENLLEHHLREITFIKGGDKGKWKYITYITTPDINFHFIEASFKVIYKDSLESKYCAVQLFYSSNGTIWSQGEYENFKIGILKRKPSLKLNGDIDKK